TEFEEWGDFGQWATLAYQMTGDLTYAAKAWDKIQGMVANPDILGESANNVREFFEDYVLMYDWLRPSLDQEQRDLYIQGLNYWCDYSLNTLPIADDGWGFRPSDKDQTFGQYFGLALVALATAPDTPLAGTWLNRVNDGPAETGLPIGG